MGLGHSLTVIVVGAAMILFNVTIPGIGLGMELSVGAMLVVLGLLNVAAFRNFRPSTRRLARSDPADRAFARAQSWRLRAHASARPRA